MIYHAMSDADLRHLAGPYVPLGDEKRMQAAEEIKRLRAALCRVGQQLEHAICARPFDLVDHLKRQREFSAVTFGPGARTADVVAHIRKELQEIEAKPSDLKEWIDVAILAFDGAWRMGATAEQIVAALVVKQDINEARRWPHWRTTAPDSAIEHVRSAEEARS